MRGLGFEAVRVVPWLWNLPHDDRRYYPIYAECCELGIPFPTQIGHTGPLVSAETAGDTRRAFLHDNAARVFHLATRVSDRAGAFPRGRSAVMG